MTNYIYFFDAPPGEDSLYEKLSYNSRDARPVDNEGVSYLEWPITSVSVVPHTGYICIGRGAEDERLSTWQYELPSMVVSGWEPGRILRDSQMTPRVHSEWSALPETHSISWRIAGGLILAIVCERQAIDPLHCSIDGRMYLYRPAYIRVSADSSNGESAGAPAQPAESKTPASGST